MSDPPPSPAEPDRPPSMSGPVLVVATLSLFLIVPAIVWPLFRLMQSDINRGRNDSTLVWAEREHWQVYEVRYKSLEYGLMSQGRTGQRYNPKLNLHVEPDFEASIRRCREYVLTTGDKFATDGTATFLRAEIASHPDHFYAEALLALWHEAQDDTEAAQSAWTRAYQAAPAALIQQVTSQDGKALEAQPLGTIAFAFDRIVQNHLDPSLTLVYPEVQTGPDGYWRLPVFKGIVRIYDGPKAPAGLNEPEGQASITYAGRVGRLPDLVVTRPGDGAD